MGAARELDPRPGRPEAAALIWPWREPVGSAAPPPVGGIRLRGSIQGALAGAFGTALIVFGVRAIGTIALALGAGVALAALLSPRGLYAGIERLAAATGHVVGRALSGLLLPLLFFGVFTPFASLFRRGHRDAMTRFNDPDAESYWSKRDRGRSASKSRTRQY